MEPVETQAEAQPEIPPNLQGSSRNSDAGAKSSRDAPRISPVKTTTENGARVSLNRKDGIGGSNIDGSGAGSEVPVEAMGDRSDVNLGGNEEGLEDSEMNGVSSLLKMQEGKSLHGLGTVLDVLDVNDITEFDSSNGVSLVADVCGDVNFSDSKGKANYGSSLRGEPLDGNEEHSDVREMEDENSGDEEHEFSVGDFVWGKIRSHPWWPGRIYDPLDASDYAKKVKQGDKILVAYFGDGTFAWCNPSQLKPLDDNFVEMSNQSSSKNFVNSVENAMDEIGRLVDLKMTCSCVPKDNLIGFGRTLVVNAGIKEGLLIPEGGIDKFSAVLFEPVELLTELKDAAQVATATSMLEFTVLKSWLSAFYRAKGGHQLPSYYDPKPVPGLEDNSRDWTDDIGDYNGVEVRIQGPEEEEDWLSSPGGRKYGQTTQNPLHKCQGVAVVGHYQRRKQKSLAEILEVETDVQAAENTSEGLGGGEKNSSQATSSTKRKKSKSMGEGATDEGKIEGNDGTRGEKFYKPKPTSGGKKVKSGKNDNEGKDKTEAVADLGKPRPSSGRKKRKGSDEVDVDNKGGSDMLSESDGGRMKKNSASIPSRIGKKRNSNLKDDNGGEENEAMKKSNSAEKVDGSNPSSRGRKKRNSNLKDYSGGEENEAMKKSNSAEKVDGSNPSSLSRKKRNSNLKVGNARGKNEAMKENSDSAEKVDGSNPSSRGRKKRNSNVKDDNGVGENEEMKDNSNSAEKVDGSASGKDKTKELLREESFSRERKKSKYLSPPYTNIDKGHGKKEMEVESLKVSSEAQLGEKPTKSANHLNGSPRIQLSVDRSQNQLFKEIGAGPESDSSGRQTPNRDQTIDPSLVKAPANEILYKIRSAALNPLYLKDTNSVDMVGQFFSAFRSTSYCSESNGEYSENRRGRKREFQKPEPVTSVKERSQTKTNSNSPDLKSQRKKIRKSEEAKPDEPKEKQDATVPKAEDTKKKKDKDKDSNGEASGASLFVTFGPGSSLPSKNDLIKIYGKFGALNKQETEMFYANYCARVVFLRSSEAEEAFNVSQLSSPFGAANVTFRLRYLSAETKTRELREISSNKPSSSAKEGGKTPELQSASQSSDSNLSELKFMKEKLENITSLIETSDGKISPDMKSTLEGEIEVLLDKVSAMISSS